MRDPRRPPDPRSTRLKAGRLLGVTVALVGALTAAACSTPDDPREDLRRTVARVSMTVAGAATTVDNLEHIPVSARTADRNLADAAARVDEAEQRILLLDVDSADEPTRRQALRLVQEAADDLADTRAWMSGVDPDQPTPTDALRDVANRLLELSDEMRAARDA